MYLHHRSSLDEFFMSSDSVIQTFTRWPALKPITEQLAESENEAFRTIGRYGGLMRVSHGRAIGAAVSAFKHPRSHTSNQNLVSFSCLIRQADMLGRCNWHPDLGIQGGRCGTRTHDLSRVNPFRCAEWHGGR
jgi:hypothetical protein